MTYVTFRVSWFFFKRNARKKCEYADTYIKQKIELNPAIENEKM